MNANMNMDKDMETNTDADADTHTTADEAALSVAFEDTESMKRLLALMIFCISDEEATLSHAKF
jgi:hypothetical protein